MLLVFKTLAQFKVTSSHKSITSNLACSDLKPNPLVFRKGFGTSQLVKRATGIEKASLIGRKSYYKMNSTLWSKIQEKYDKSQKSGAAFKTETKVEVLEDPQRRVDFVLRIATALQAKTNASNLPNPAASPSTIKKNPFLPPEPELLVGQLGDQHNLILNKFNVVPYHVIVSTIEFRSQTEPLYAADLRSLWEILEAFPGDAVGFYNCGPCSGRSQPHKHMQVVPLPFSPEFPAAGYLHHAVDRAAVESGLPYYTPFAVRSLPYCCYAAKFKPGDRASPELLAALFDKLRDLAVAALPGVAEPSYNFLMTRRFMMLVPRSREFSGPCALNSLQYAGTFFVRDDAELQYVKQTGPFAMLTEAGVEWTPAAAGDKESRARPAAGALSLSLSVSSSL